MAVPPGPGEGGTTGTGSGFGFRRRTVAGLEAEGEISVGTVIHGLAIDRAVNIGPVLSARLRAVGVETLEQLKRQGALEVWQLIAAQTPPEECVHTLLALEGAIRATRWTAIDQGERNRLVAAAGLEA